MKWCQSRVICSSGHTLTAKKKEGRFLSLILFVVEESRDDKRLSLSGEEKLVNRQSARHPPIYLLLQTPSS